MPLEFAAWPKIARWKNEVMTITEKIDGTNACVVIAHMDDYDAEVPDSVIAKIDDGEQAYSVQAQSRSRFIMPGKNTDNAGFALWVQSHAVALVKALGLGRHYGEWWGSGIQSGYGFTGGQRTFSLFNVHRWEGVDLGVDNLTTVPVIFKGAASEAEIEKSLDKLRREGSLAAPGFMRPEGVIIQYKLTQQTYKAFVNDDGIPKSLKEGN
jgi:hypothetical protein